MSNISICLPVIVKIKDIDIKKGCTYAYDHYWSMSKNYMVLHTMRRLIYNIKYNLLHCTVIEISGLALSILLYQFLPCKRLMCKHEIVWRLLSHDSIRSTFSSFNFANKYYPWTFEPKCRIVFKITKRGGEKQFILSVNEAINCLWFILSIIYSESIIISQKIIYDE